MSSRLLYLYFFEDPVPTNIAALSMVHLDQLGVGDRVVHGRLQVLDHGHRRGVHLFSQTKVPNQKWTRGQTPPYQSKASEKNGKYVAR